MEKESFENNSQLRAAVQFAVIQVCSDVEAASGSTAMSPAAIAALSELTVMYATTSLAPDLEAFRDHAGRRTVNDSDVKLAARKLPEELYSSLVEFCHENCTTATSTRTAEGALPSVKRKATGLVDLQGKNKSKSSDLDMDSDSSSSLSESLLSKPAVPSRSKIKTAPAMNSKILDDSDDDDDIEILDPIPPVRRAERENLPLNRMKDNDDDDDLPPVKPMAKRFSLKKRTALQDDSSSDSDMDFGSNLINHEVPLTALQPSSLKHVMDTLSQDSAFSG